MKIMLVTLNTDEAVKVPSTFSLTFSLAGSSKGSGCSDPAADNFDPCSSTNPGDNRMCKYSCSGLGEHFDVAAPTECYIYGQRWPPGPVDTAGNNTYTVPGSSAVIQGMAIGRNGVDRAALTSRVEILYSAEYHGPRDLVLRHVSMSELAAIENRTDNEYYQGRYNRQGGAVLAAHIHSEGQVIIDYCHFFRNTGIGAIALNDGAGSIRVSGCLFHENNNPAYAAAGRYTHVADAIYMMYNGGNTTIADTVFRDHVGVFVDTNGQIFSGGATLYVQGNHGPTEVTRCVFENNSFTIDFYHVADGMISNCSFVKNILPQGTHNAKAPIYFDVGYWVFASGSKGMRRVALVDCHGMGNYDDPDQPVVYVEGYEVCNDGRDTCDRWNVSYSESKLAMLGSGGLRDFEQWSYLSVINSSNLNTSRDCLLDPMPAHSVEGSSPGECQRLFPTSSGCELECAPGYSLTRTRADSSSACEAKPLGTQLAYVPQACERVQESIEDGGN